MIDRPKVCLVSHAYLEKRYRAKLSYLGQRVDLTVITPDQFPSPYGVYRADFSDSSGYRAQAHPCWFPLGVRTSTRWMLASRDLGFRALHPDIVQVENEAHSFSAVQAVLCRRRYAPRAKVILFVWANMTLPGLTARSLDLLARTTMPGIDHYIAGSSDARRLLIARGIPEDKTSQFPQVGVDIEYYAPPTQDERVRARAAIGLAPDEFVVGFVGRFVADKGITDLVEAVRLTRARCSPARIRLMCIGDGGLKSTLMADGDIIVASPGGSGPVLSYYHSMDALVLPSRTMRRWKEQLGLALVEAMACGVPVIGSTSGAIPEVIGLAGCIFREGDREDLSASLSALMASPARRLALSAAGRKRAIDNFSGRRIAELTCDTYQRVLATERVR